MYVVIRKCLRCVGLAAVCAALLTPTETSASVVVPLSLDELVGAARVIVDASVGDVRTVEGPQGLERLVLLRVIETWKGGAEATLWVRLAGGRLGRTETRVPGVPAVSEDDRLVWFLVPHPRGGYSVVGLHQGALPAVAGPDGALRVLAPSRQAGGRGSVTRAPRRLDDLATTVRALLRAEAAQ